MEICNLKTPRFRTSISIRLHGNHLWSPEWAIESLNLEVSKEALGDKGKLKSRPGEMRDGDSGISCAGAEWSAYGAKDSTKELALAQQSRNILAVEQQHAMDLKQALGN